MNPSVLSLGAGTQSSALLLLAVDDELPDDVARPELAVFADTGGEPAAVYDWLGVLRELAEPAGIRVETVRHLHDVDLADEPGRVPVFLDHGPDQPRGMARRYCTSDWKVAPVRRACQRERRRIRERDQLDRLPQLDLLLGMSVDEVHRCRSSRVGYLVNRYPLVDLGWRRSRTIAYVRDRTGQDPPRSACVFCPYRSGWSWRQLREQDPDGWAQAVAVDESLRAPDAELPPGWEGWNGTPYLHGSLRPLAEAVLTPDDAGQLALLDDHADGFGNDCEGGCGL